MNRIMSGRLVHPVMIGLLVVALGVAAWLTSTGKPDAQPSRNTLGQSATAVVVGAQTQDAVNTVANVINTSGAQRRLDVPDVLTRIGFTINQGLHVVPTEWCRDHQTICMNTLKDRFADKAKANPSGNPSPHANDNMRRVYLNSFAINPKAKDCGALCSYNHYRDDVNQAGGYCQMGWKVVGGVSLGQPAYPECHQVAWGGPDGTDAGTNFDNQDRGFVVCAGTVLGTAAGEVVFSGGAAAPAAGITVGAGTFGCGVGWALSKWLF